MKQAKGLIFKFDERSSQIYFKNSTFSLDRVIFLMLHLKGEIKLK